MELLRKFLRLPTAERRLLIKATLLLEAIKLGMRLLPFRTLRRLLARVVDTPKGRRLDQPSVEKLTWAVRAASRNMPGVKTCLAQALATHVLLARHSYSAILHIGVARGEQKQFQAHAWVEIEGKAVIGGSEIGRYAPLAVLVEDPRELRDQKLCPSHDKLKEDGQKAGRRQGTNDLYLSRTK